MHSRVWLAGLNDDFAQKLFIWSNDALCMTTINRLQWNESRTIPWKRTILLNFVWPTRAQVFLMLPATVIKINATDQTTIIATIFNMCHTIFLCMLISQCAHCISQKWAKEGGRAKGTKTRHACRLVDIFLWIIITNDARLVVRFPFGYIEHTYTNVFLRFLVVEVRVKMCACRWEWWRCVLETTIDVGSYNINKNGGECGGDHIKDRKWSACTGAQKTEQQIA